MKQQIEAEMLEIIEKSREEWSHDVTDHTENEYIREGLLNEGYRKQEWISVEERLPDPEVEVLIFAVRKYVCKGERWECPIITTAMYENGKVTTDESDWSWYDLDFVYDEENDCYYIPEGWWEYRHYNPDDVYNSAVDDKVLYWMPLPEPPKGDRNDS